MIRQPGIRLLVTLELFALPTRDGAEDGLRTVAKEVFALQYAKRFSTPEEPLLGSVDVTLAEGEVIDGIEQVGFSHAVVTEEAIDLRRAVDVSLTEIFIVQDGEFVQYHIIKRG